MQEDVLFEFSESVPDGSSELKNAHVRSSHVFRKAPEPQIFKEDLLERIPEDDICRTIKSGLEHVDLSPVLSLYKTRGGVPYHYKEMLGAILLGYAIGRRSHRDLASLCRYDLRFVYITGGLTPDDRTFGRFIQRISPVLDPLFKQVVNACAKQHQGLGAKVAVDGTKLSSPAARISLSTEEVEQLGVPCQTTDPEAKLMRTSKGFVLGYNVQAAVDMDTGLVLAVEVSDNGSDAGQLPSVLNQVQEALGKAPDEVVADAGYDSSQSYHYCDAHDIHCYIPAQEKDILFWTAVGDGQIVCPMGQEPTNISYRTDKGVPRVQYSISRTKCKKCPLFDECCPRHNKHLTCFDTLAPVSRVLAAHRARSPEGKQALKRRMATIEPFFAQLKWNRNLSRLTLRGRKGAKLQVQLFALVTNLRILAKGVLDLSLRQICRVFCQRFGAKGTYPRALHLCTTG